MSIISSVDSERFYEKYSDVPSANIAHRPLAHGAEAVVEHINGEIVLQLRVKAPVASQISPMLTESEWRKIDRDIDNASSFDLNIRNLEKPWEDVYLQVLAALVRDGNEQISTKAQYLVWRFTDDDQNTAIVNLGESVRGTKGTTKELIPDVVNVIRVTLPGGYHENVLLTAGELKRAISRQHTCHLDPESGKLHLSYHQIPNSVKGVKLLLASLTLARGQVERQALLQHCVYVARYGQSQPELVPILSREMVLVAAVGPWFMVARRANCIEAWKELREARPDLKDMDILERLERLGYQKGRTTTLADDDADPAETHAILVQDLEHLKDSEVQFDFSTTKRQEVAGFVRSTSVFVWDEELFNVRESRGWAVLHEIKEQIHDDVASFCDNKGEMNAMRVDVV